MLFDDVLNLFQTGIALDILPRSTSLSIVCLLLGEKMDARLS